jgi:hypothetical protein
MEIQLSNEELTNALREAHIIPLYHVVTGFSRKADTGVTIYLKHMNEVTK